MTDQKDINAEIRERQEKINELRREIDELKQPYSLKKLMENQMLDVNSRMEIMELSSCVEAWEYFRKGCIYLFKPKHYGESMTLKTLTRDEINVVAEMADEIVLIWNKYIRMVYGKEKQGE